jgi:hypothetical protein
LIGGAVRSIGIDPYYLGTDFKNNSAKLFGSDLVTFPNKLALTFKGK